MPAFRVFLNGKKLCVAGVGQSGVLSTIVNYVASDHVADLFMEVGGLAKEQHLSWIKQKRLAVGDEVRVKVIESLAVDPPAEKRRTHPAETLKAKKRYVRQMAKELDWKIQPITEGTSKRRELGPN